MHESCTLIGVVDETGLLEENEVFVQVRKDSLKHNSYPEAFPGVDPLIEEDQIPHILTGKLLVTRNPCLNPGDLRLL